MKDLPIGWASAPLGRISIINPGPPGHLGDDHLVSFVPMASVEAGSGRLDASGRKPLRDVRGKSYRAFADGDVLFAKVTPCMENGKIALASDLVNGIGFGSSEFHVVRAQNGIAARYLMHFLLQRRFREDARRSMSGTAGLLRVSSKFLEDAEVPIPPTPEQERIVAAIEEQFSRLDAGVAALRSARRKLKTMRAAVLQAAVTGHLVQPVTSEDVDETLTAIEADRRAIWANQKMKPYKPPALAARFPLQLPGHWRLASLEALTDPVRVICYGILMPKENIAGGVPYVRVKDMRGWAIDLDGLKRTSREIADSYARASLAKDDLLLAIRGSYGRVARVPEELEGGNITQDTARIAAHPLVDRRYLLYYLGGSVGNRYYERVARGVAVKGVNIGDLRTMPVPLPPRAEQVAIADEVERQFTILDAMEAANEQQLRRAASLRSSILSTAFSGTLVVQDPGDETASVLLERIAAQTLSYNGSGSTADHKRSTPRLKAHT